MSDKDIHQMILLEMLGLSWESLEKLREISRDNSSKHQTSAKVFLTFYQTGVDRFDGNIFDKIRAAIGSKQNDLRLIAAEEIKKDESEEKHGSAK